MGFDLSEKQSKWDLLMSPGPIITVVGLVILAIAVFFFSSASPSTEGVDAILESQANNGQRIKSMVVLILGTVVSIAGVLWSLISFSRR